MDRDFVDSIGVDRLTVGRLKAAGSMSGMLLLESTTLSRRAYRNRATREATHGQARADAGDDAIVISGSA